MLPSAAKDKYLHDDAWKTWMCSLAYPKFQWVETYLASTPPATNHNSLTVTYNATDE